MTEKTIDAGFAFKALCEDELHATYRYIMEKKQFMKRMESGCWEKCFDEEFDHIIEQFLIKNDKNLTTNAKNSLRGVAKTNLKSRLLDWNNWFESREWLVGNGILNVDTKELRDATPDDLWSQQIPHNYIEQVEEPTWFLEQLKTATDDWEPVLSFLAAIVQQKKLRYVMFFLGPPSYGKSPYLILALKLIGKSYSGLFSMDKIGEASGLATIFDKILGVDEDMNMSYVKNSFFTTAKKLCGDESDIDIKLLYKDVFEVTIRALLLIGTNQMGKIVQGVNETGLYKRAYIALFKKQKFADNDIFLDKMYEEEHLSQIFSYLMNYKIIDQRKEMGIEAFMKRTGKLWEDSAFPVMTIINKYYECNNEDDTCVYQRDVVKVVVEDLKKNEVKIPQNLTAEITETMNKLGGRKGQRDKLSAYIGIKRKGATVEEVVMPKAQSAELDNDFDIPSLDELPEDFFDDAAVKAKPVNVEASLMDELMKPHVTNTGGWTDEEGNPIKEKGW